MPPAANTTTTASTDTTPAPCLLIVAPNGARRGKADHPALPISPAEMADEVAACSEAGAAMVHLHARKPDGSHSLEIDDNAAMLQAVNDRIGDRMLVQLTTEAVGLYQPEQQMALIRELQPEAASFALRELIPDDSRLEAAAEFFAWVRSQGILAQYILYSADELQRYQHLINTGVLPTDGHHLLFVLGRYTQGQQSEPHQLQPFLQQLSPQLPPQPPSTAGDNTQPWEPSSMPPWALCAFGQQEQKCLLSAASQGGDVRVGFENNLLRPDGSQAASNAEQVARLKQAIEQLGRPLHSAISLRCSYKP